MLTTAALCDEASSKIIHDKELLLVRRTNLLQVEDNYQRSVAYVEKQIYRKQISLNHAQARRKNPFATERERNDEQSSVVLTYEIKVLLAIQDSFLAFPLSKIRESIDMLDWEIEDLQNDLKEIAAHKLTLG